MIGTLISAIIAGIIIGALARLVLPGKQNISILMTIVLGAIGSLAGSWLYTAISGKSGTNGIDWIALILGVDRLMDMIRTVVNITGDAVGSVSGAKAEAKSDLAAYADPEAGLGESLAIDHEAEAALAAESRPHPAE